MSRNRERRIPGVLKECAFVVCDRCRVVAGDLSRSSQRPENEETIANGIFRFALRAKRHAYLELDRAGEYLTAT